MSCCECKESSRISRDGGGGDGGGGWWWSIFRVQDLTFLPSACGTPHPASVSRNVYSKKRLTVTSKKTSKPPSLPLTHSTVTLYTVRTHSPTPNLRFAPRPIRIDRHGIVIIAPISFPPPSYSDVGNWGVGGLGGRETKAGRGVLKHEGTHTYIA